MDRSRDPHHDAQLLRDLRIINARTAAELGPLPPGGLPVEPKRKPKPWRRMALQVPAHPEMEDESMKLSRAAVAAAMGITAMLAACDAGTAPRENSETTVQQEDRGQGVSPAGKPANERANVDMGQAKHRTAQARPQEGNAFIASLDDLSIRIHTQDCRSVMETLVECTNGSTIEISSPNLKDTQTIRVDALYLNPRVAVYRGPLDGSYRKDEVPIIISDIDLDGHEDIAILTGRSGAYGSASYDIYLYDKELAAYSLNRPFSDLTVGHLGMFLASNGKITAYGKSGCCEHTEETYAIENGKPKLIKIITETADGAAAPTRTVKKLIDGKLQAVQE